MAVLDVREATTYLLRLLERVAAGGEILIARAGRPIAELVPITPARTPAFGMDRRRVEVPEDFDAPLPDLLAP